MKGSVAAKRHRRDRAKPFVQPVTNITHKHWQPACCFGSRGWRCVMRSMRVAVFAIILLTFPSFARTEPPPDSRLQILSGVNSVAGEMVFMEKGCFDCHSYDNAG